MYHATAHFYGFFDADMSDAERRVRFISQFLGSKSQTLIDVGAGNGEIAFRFARLGYKVHCLEPSRSMNAILLERLAHQSDLHLKVSAYPCLVEDLKESLQANFAYASSVFSHLSFDARLSLMRSLKSHLLKNGLFVFNGVRQIGNRTDKPFTLLAEKKIGDVTYRHFDSAEQIRFDKRKVNWRFETESPFSGKQVFEESFLLNLDNSDSIQKLLTESGFELIEEFGSWEKEDRDKTKTGMVIVARSR